MTSPDAPMSADEDQQGINGIDRLVHEPARLLVLANLYIVDSADYTFLVQQTGLTWGNLSSHLTKLEAAGYLEIEKEFVDKRPRTRLRLTEQGRTAVRDYRQRMQGVLDTLPE
jgi:DNA-binding MarR family transcriptional regulator